MVARSSHLDRKLDLSLQQAISFIPTKNIFRQFLGMNNWNGDPASISKSTKKHKIHWGLCQIFMMELFVKMFSQKFSSLMCDRVRNRLPVRTMKIISPINWWPKLRITYVAFGNFLRVLHSWCNLEQNYETIFVVQNIWSADNNTALWINGGRRGFPP